MPLRPPPDIVEAAIGPLLPAAQLGAVTGFIGACLGGGVGILQSAHPGLAFIYTGAQCFVLGSSFIYTRQVSLSIRSDTFSDIRRREVAASTLAGTVSGAAAGRFWSRPTSVVGAVAFGALGYFGQKAQHRAADRPYVERDRRPFLQKLADSKFSPIKNLSNEDYESMLSDKLYKVVAEIAIVDEKLLELKQVEDQSIRTTIEKRSDSQA